MVLGKVIVILLILFVSSFIFYRFLRASACPTRRYYIVVALLSYLIAILLDQLYMEESLGLLFHPSDPVEYFRATHLASFSKLLETTDNDNLSNKFYFFLNWLVFHNCADTFWNSVLLYVSNSLVFLSAYVAITSDSDRFRYTELLILFNPLLYMMLYRNVRDAYIIFFMVIMVRVISKNYRMKKDIFAFSLSTIALYYLRSFMLAPIAVIIAINSSGFFKKHRIATMVGGGILLAIALYFHETLLHYLIMKYFSTFLSTQEFFGEDKAEIQSVFQEMVSTGAISASFLKHYLLQILKSLHSFFTVPAPFWYLGEWQKSSKHGIYNIYTDVDSVLIIAGGLLNFVVIFPLMIKWFFERKREHWEFFAIGVSIYLIYTCLYLGKADMRIKLTALIFFLAPAVISDLRISWKDWKYAALPWALLAYNGLMNL